MAIVQDGAWFDCAATASPRAGGRAGHRDTVFRLASLSKAFAATLTAQLVQRGAMSWDRPIIEPAAGVQAARLPRAQQVTVRDVLSHRSA
jgi:beta-lactamase class C